jgi:hypothetical protein
MRFLWWAILLATIAASILFALFAVASPGGLPPFFFCLWAVLFLSRKADRLAVAALVACGLSILFCLHISVSDPSEHFYRGNCHSNLRRIALAMRDYADRYGTLPPAYIADSHGKPVHSWRVLILPFLGQERLYKKYSFDEPWDGPNNRILHKEIENQYQCWSDTSVRVDGMKTSYVVVTGDRTAFPGSHSVKLSDIRKPLKDVLLVVEVANSGIDWMEPRDLPLSEMDFKVNGKPGKSLSSGHGSSWIYGYYDVVNAAYADGDDKSVPLDISPDALKNLLMIDEPANTK